MENQLIVYKPKIKVKRIILIVLLLLFISILIFAFTAFFTSMIFAENKWNKTKNVDLQSTQMDIDSNRSSNH